MESGWSRCRWEAQLNLAATDSVFQPFLKSKTKDTRTGKIYLCINRKGGLPVLRRDHSTDSIFPSFRRNLLNVCHGILEFLLCGPKCRGLGQAMRAHALRRLAGSIGLTAPLDCGEIQRR